MRWRECPFNGSCTVALLQSKAQLKCMADILNSPQGFMYGFGMHLQGFCCHNTVCTKPIEKALEGTGVPGLPNQFEHVWASSRM